jgi:hypothetical protein
MLRQVGAQAFDEVRSGGAGGRPRLAAVLAAGAVPLVVLGLLLSAPHLDGHWENNSAHFWIVLIAGLVSTSFGYAVREAAIRRHDAAHHAAGRVAAWRGTQGFAYRPRHPGCGGGRQERRVRDRAAGRPVFAGPSSPPPRST